MDGLKIGEVAARAEVNIETLRYYERCALIEAPARSSSNYRLYSPGTVKVVRFIKRSQELGFSLKEVKELLSLRNAPEASSAAVRAIAEQKVSDITGKIVALEKMRAVLSELIDHCSGEGPVAECPILEAIELDQCH